MKRTVLYVMFAAIAALALALPAAAQTTLLSENFDGVTPTALPAGWAEVHTVGSSTYAGWTTQSSLTYPTATPHSAPNAARFYSFLISSANEYRLYRTTGANLCQATTGTVTLSFWMYHDNGSSSNNDRVQIQYSTNGGGTWTNVAGAVFSRYAATNGWTQHNVDLSALALGQSDFRIAFLGISAYGYNIFIDDVTLVASASLPNLSYTSYTMADHCATGGAGDMDGVADPGESLDITVLVANSGTTTGFPGGTLTTTTPNVTIPTDTTTWNSGIPAGSTGTPSNSPFVVDVGASVPCGTLISFNLALTSPPACVTNWPFTIRVGAAQAPVVVYTQNFDTGLTVPALPGDWATAVVGTPSGTTPPAWATNAGTHHPSSVASQSAPNCAYFNSYHTSSGNQARLYQTAAMNFSTYGGGTLSFYMYHDTGYSSNTAEGVQPQYSLNGTTWTSFGSLIPRYASTAGWTQHTVALPDAVASQPSVYIAFLGSSQYGNDCHIDTVSVSGISYLCHLCSACVIDSCNASAPSLGFAGFPVNFTGEETHTGCAGTPTWSWTFTDGGTSTDQNPSHTFAAPGLYGYTMTVTIDGVTCTTEGGWIQICSLECTASADPTSGYLPLTVSFAANAIISNCGTNNRQEITYLWDFGDGTAPSTDQYTTHTYTIAGTYTWTCTITVDGTVCTQTGVIVVQAFDMHFWDDYNTGWLCVDSSNGFWVYWTFTNPYFGIYSGRSIVAHGPGTFRLVVGDYPGVKLTVKLAMHQAHAELWLTPTIMAGQLKDMNTADDPPECPPLTGEPTGQKR